MSKTRAITIAILLILAVIYYQPVMAASPLYVRIGGSDANCNGTVDVDWSAGVQPNCAKRTIEAATTIVDSGGTVIVRAGTYSTEAFPISIARSLTLQGDGSTTTIIDQVAHNQIIISVNGAYVVNIYGFTIRNGTRGIYYLNGVSGHIENNTIFNNSVNGIQNGDPATPGSGANPTIRFNYILQNGTTAPYNGGIRNNYSNPTIHTNVIYNNGHGIENRNSSPTIYNNTIIGSMNHGIANQVSSPTVVNNIIAVNGGRGINVDASSTVTNDYNDVWNNTGGNYSASIIVGAHSISQDPLFVSYPTDVHLQCTPTQSPAIDSGTSAGAPATDMDGTMIPQGAGVDMGAYETACYSVTANANGTGTGTVTSNVGGVNYNYPANNTGTTSTLNYGTNVVLTGTAGTGSTASWNNCVAAGGAVAGNGTATATCTFSSLNGNKTVTATFTLNQYTVTANASGNGTGNVSSNVGGINYNYPTNNTGTTSPLNYGSNITLTAAAGTGSTASWTDCTSQGGTVAGNGTTNATCTYNNLTGSMIFSVTFTLDQFTITANANGNGTGTVSSNVGGMNYNYPANNTGTSSAINYGTSVVLTAAAGIGSTAAWNDCVAAGGTIAGNGTATATCTFSSLDGNKTVTVTFTLNQYALIVTIVGNGTVTSNPAGINCGSDCVEVYNYGTIVTLTAIPTAISSFTGWSGACTGTALTCTLTIDAAKNVTATFGIKQGKKVQLPSLLPMALNNMASAKVLLNQANELLSQAKAKGKDTGTCENLIREATELLTKANTVRTNPIYANNLALQAIAKLKQALECLKALIG
jgi:hypothetical protein